VKGQDVPAAPDGPSTTVFRTFWRSSGLGPACGSGTHQHAAFLSMKSIVCLAAKHKNAIISHR